MEIIRALIVDDESRARSVLKRLLSDSNYNNIKLVAECSNVEDAVTVIKKLNPDIVFLDVQMPNYAGYEIVNFFDKIDFEIIFVTAYDQYAIKAFELCAIDYLVKPIDRKRLTLAIKKLITKLDAKNNLEKYQTLLDTLQKKEFRKLVIPELGNRRVLNLSDIIAIGASGAYTTIFLKDSIKITTSKNLKYYEKALIGEKNFFRSHRSWIININYLKSYNRTDSLIDLGDNLMAKISRNYYSDFERLFENKKGDDLN